MLELAMQHIDQPASYSPELPRKRGMYSKIVDERNHVSIAPTKDINAGFFRGLTGIYAYVVFP
jgi:hypothetical protein